MHGADEFLCRNCVILKCEAVALVRHRKNQSFSTFFLLHLRLRSIASIGCIKRIVNRRMVEGVNVVNSHLIFGPKKTSS